tara:strand:- start:3433 stop:3960 length:528 start_codon:yes stop_codon:yes gene_type:complete
MALSNYIAGLEMVLGHEGSFSDDPDDRGGATMMGVTQKVYEEWMGREVTKDEMREMPREHIDQIYKDNYWDVIQADLLPGGLDIAVFDLAINAGTGRSAKILQSIVGAKEDGAIGSRTIEKVMQHNPSDVLEKFTKKRKEFYDSIVKNNPSQKKFIKGWTRRNKETHEFAKKMMG